MLIYTGQKHLSSDIHEAVWGGYQRGEPRVVEALRNLRRIAVDMREALMAHDLDTFGGLMNENWENQKSLHDSITNPTVDRLVAVACRSGAIGVKACGAGGGGCLICLAAEGGEERLAEAITAAGGGASVQVRLVWRPPNEGLNRRAPLWPETRWKRRAARIHETPRGQ